MAEQIESIQVQIESIQAESDVPVSRHLSILDKCKTVFIMISTILCILTTIGLVVVICYSLYYAGVSSPTLDTPYYQNCRNDDIKPWCVNNCNCVYCDIYCIEWEYRHLCDGEWISKRNSTECQEILEFRESVMDWWSNIGILSVLTIGSLGILYILFLMSIKFGEPEDL